MRCWRCKSEMPEGLKYCGNCGVHMNRTVYLFQWLFSKKGLPVVIAVLALVIGAAAWYIIPKIRTPEITLDPNMGWYSPKEDNIVYYDDAGSYGYINNMILVYFMSDTTDEQIAEVVESIDGEVVGVLPGVRQYQVEIPARSEEELEQLRKELLQFDVVKNAVMDHVVSVENETAAVPNDPWEDPELEGTCAVWNEDEPEGGNWWAEAVRLISAWQYEENFTHAHIGVVDVGFDPNHEDLKLNLRNPHHNKPDDHGTHVAGIIGAIHDNGMGISGVVENKTLSCVDCKGTLWQRLNKTPVSSLMAGIDNCIVNGAEVINLSMGLKYGYVSENPESVEMTARTAAEYMIMMMDTSNRHFIIVQSAGNYAEDAAEYNGYFASIDEQLVQSVLDEMKADGVKLERDITAQDVMNSIIVVAAVDYERVNGKYQLSEFSNYGDVITVAAPGVHILSTVCDGYDYMDGTSMAAPIVSGITAMVWSVDPTLSAGEVKNIVVSTATEPVRSRVSGDSGTYYMINAQAAVEKALGRTGGSYPSVEELFNNTCWHMCYGQSLGFNYYGLFRLDGTLRVRGVNGLEYPDGTYEYDSSTGRMTVYFNNWADEFQYGDGSFISVDKYQMQVGEDYLTISPEPDALRYFEEPSETEPVETEPPETEPAETEPPEFDGDGSSVAELSIGHPANRTSYYVGDQLDLTGLMLEVLFDDGSKSLYDTEFAASPMTLAEEGTQTITVTFRGKTVTYDVMVMEPEVYLYKTEDEISLEEAPVVDPAVYDLNGTFPFWRIELPEVKVFGAYDLPVTWEVEEAWLFSGDTWLFTDVYNNEYIAARQPGKIVARAKVTCNGREYYSVPYTVTFRLYEQTHEVRDILYGPSLSSNTSQKLPAGERIEILEIVWDPETYEKDGVNWLFGLIDYNGSESWIVIS